MITFVSDLDRTLIYSKRNINVDKEDIQCVEYIDDRSITYMTKVAYQKFLTLITNSEFMFIPCTLRSFEQTSRITFIQEYLPHFIICDNGGRIYIDGKEDFTYRNQIMNNVDLKKLEEYKPKIEKMIVDGYVKYDNQSFLTCIFKSKETAEMQMNNILNKLDMTLFSYDLQDRKLYIIPKKLNKAIAMQYLIKTYELKNIITSGDGKVDKDFTKLGQKILLPKAAQFHHLGETRMIYDGILGGEEIIDQLLTLLQLFHQEKLQNNII